MADQTVGNEQRVVKPRPWRRNTASDFWAKVAIAGPDECWPWQGSLSPRGYGSFKWETRHRRAHCVAYEIANDTALPLEKFSKTSPVVRHTCDNPPCCNPNHLILGTCAENIQDAAQKGRMPKGDNHFQKTRPELAARGSGHSSSKLTEADVIDIRNRIASGQSKPSVAQLYGVGKSNIKKIWTRKAWKHVP